MNGSEMSPPKWQKGPLQLFGAVMASHQIATARAAVIIAIVNNC